METLDWEKGSGKELWLKSGSMFVARMDIVLRFHLNVILNLCEPLHHLSTSKKLHIFPFALVVRFSKSN